MQIHATVQRSDCCGRSEHFLLALAEDSSERSSGEGRGGGIFRLENGLNFNSDNCILRGGGVDRGSDRSILWGINPLTIIKIFLMTENIPKYKLFLICSCLTSQNCSIALPSEDAESSANALQLWKLTERIVGTSWEGKIRRRFTVNTNDKGIN